jgi:hypothetical protein
MSAASLLWLLLCWLFGLYTLPEADDVDSLLMGLTDLGLVSRLIGLPAVVITGALSLRLYIRHYTVQ